MASRRSVAVICRRYILFLLTAVLIFSNGAYAADSLFCEENSVLWSSCSNSCSSTPSTPAATGTTSSGNGGGCGDNTNGSKANEDQAWNYLMGQFQGAGYSQADAQKATSGILGNWMQESAFNSYRGAGDGSGCKDNPGPVTGGSGMGIAQWCGDRQQKLADYAKDHGKDWTCLGTQLEFTWKEMNDRNLVSQMKGLSAYDSANIYDKIFEVSEGSGARASKADAVLADYTGQGPSTAGAGTPNATPASASSGNSSSNCPKSSASSNTTPGAIPSGDCGALVPEYQKLVSDGKITDTSPDWINHDLQNCTSNQITCGTSGGPGGVDPKILRAVVAGAENSGASSVNQWNFNTGHPCDEKNHPHGKAADLKCQGNSSPGGSGASDDCNKLFKYYYDNYDALGLTELIWQYPPAGYSCSDPKIMCNVDGHTDHIHIGTNK